MQANQPYQGGIFSELGIFGNSLETENHDWDFEGVPNIDLFIKQIMGDNPEHYPQVRPFATAGEQRHDIPWTLPDQHLGGLGDASLGWYGERADVEHVGMDGLYQASQLSGMPYDMGRLPTTGGHFDQGLVGTTNPEGIVGGYVSRSYFTSI